MVRKILKKKDMKLPKTTLRKFLAGYGAKQVSAKAVDQFHDIMIRVADDIARNATQSMTLNKRVKVSLTDVRVATEF